MNKQIITRPTRRANKAKSRRNARVTSIRQGNQDYLGTTTSVPATKMTSMVRIDRRKVVGLAQFTTNGAGNYTGGFDTNPTGFSSWGQWLGLYQDFRVHKISLTYVPYNRYSRDVTTVGTQTSSSVLAGVFHGTSLPSVSSIALATSYQDCAHLSLDDTFTIEETMRTESEKLYTLTTTNPPSVQRFGIWFFTPYTLDLTRTYGDIMITMTVDFRNIV